MLKSGHCLYCGTETPHAAGLAREVASRGGPSATALPAELLFALEPKASGVSSGSMWLRRVIALGLAALLLALFVGQCMKS